MNFFKKLFAKKDVTLYADIPLKNENFLNIDTADLDKYPTMLDDIINGKVDGILISSFLSKEEINRFFEKYKEYPEEKKYTKRFGTTLGYVAHDAGAGMPGYIEKATAFKNDLQDFFGFDIYERYEKIVNKLSRHKPLVRAESEQQEPYLGFNIKFMNPDYGGLIEHVGLGFYDLFPSLKYLESQIDKNGQISCFCVLRHPEKGGELVLFDLRYGEEGMKFDSFADPKLLEVVRQKANYKVKPKVGDLLMFNGGQIWHRIAEIKGDTSRVTITNFISYSKDKTKFLYWT